MFTGIVEALGTILAIEQEDANIHFTIQSPISAQCKVDQSVAHDGVCLTITSVQGDQHRVTAIRETLDRTVLGDWQTGRLVNLERCVALNTRLDGHIVQGHADARGLCISKQYAGGSWNFRFQFPAEYAALLIDKGSICVNGVSLTVVRPGMEDFGVSIIPYTQEFTNFHALGVGQGVNLEFDVLGKYFQRHLEVLEYGKGRAGGQ